MKPEVLDYLAAKVIDDIRKGAILSTDLIKVLCTVPIIDYLRREVEEKDIDYLMKYLQSEDNILVQFALALFQKNKDIPEVKEKLFLLWAESKTFDEKMNVMFRILDYPNVSIEIHTSIFDFIINNWDRWISECIIWQAENDKNKILDSIKIRLKDNRFPASKSWVYLLMATASPDKNELRNLINEYVGTNIPNIDKIKKLIDERHL